MWLAKLSPFKARHAQVPAGRRFQARPPARSKLHLEPLEDRTLLSSGWAAALGTSGSQYVALDPTSPALYVVGSQVAKYTTDGILLWSQGLGGQSASRVTVDSAGDACVTGSFTGTLVLGAQTLTSAGGNDAFVAKFDPAGNVLWAKSFGGTGDDRGNGIAVDASGVYVAGRFTNTVSFDAAHSLTGAGANDAFVLKLDPSGNVVYVTQAGGTGTDAGSHIAVDSSGRAYLTGVFAGTASFGSQSLTAAGVYDGFIGQLDASGNFTWVRQVGGPSEIDQEENASGVALDGSGHLFATGTFFGTSAFGDSRDGAGATSLTALGQMDAFVTSLDAATGHFLWTKQIGGASTNTHGYDLALDTAGNVYTAGTFLGHTGTGIDCDPGPQSANLVMSSTNFFGNGFVAKLSPTGNFLGAWQMGDTGNSFAMTTGVAVGADGGMYTAGNFTYSVRLDTGTQYVALTSSGNDSFLAKTTQGQSVIFGQVYLDSNNNHVKDTGEPPLAGVTVYLDKNNNGKLDRGELSTLSNALGGFSFYHLAAGTYTVREVAPTGYTVTPGSVTVSLVAGQFGDSASFGNYKPATTTTYTTTNPVSPTPSAPNALSSLAIRDTSFIQDPTVTLTVTNPSLLPLTIVLHAPDGTSITLAASTNSNGTLSFHVPAFDGKNVNGTWTLEVDGLSGGTLNSWSMSVLG